MPETVWHDRATMSDVLIIWARIQDRFEPISVTVEAPPGDVLTAEFLRKVPFGQIVDTTRPRPR